MSEVLPQQVIEVGDQRRVVRTVYKETGVPGPGSWIIFKGGWKPVKLTAGNKWLLIKTRAS